MLGDLLLEEYLYEHPLLTDLICRLKDNVSQSSILQDMLLQCIEFYAFNDDEHTSIVWVARRFANKIGDRHLLSLTEQIRSGTL